ncbi:unnamed protein product [Orchesella dallaii]|uniref:GDT1 family protein n=1 Tax=Orchesella dallaii TaxID=48710 RepID=A0ABP1R510_9HEXA
MKMQGVESGAAQRRLSSQQYLDLLPTSEAIKKQTLSLSSVNKEDLEDSLGCSKDMSTVANRRRNMKEGLCSDKDLGDLIGNGSGKKSKRQVGCGMSSSLGKSLWIMIMILLIVTFSYVVAAKFEDLNTVSKYEFKDKVYWRWLEFQLIDLFPFKQNVTPVQPGGGRTSTKGSGKETRSVVSAGFLYACIASFSVTVTSVLGDKTFFIAAIMAMRYSRLRVFSGAIGALSLLTVVSALFGYATTIIPKAITYYTSTVFFAIFGLKMMYDGYRMSPHEGQQKRKQVKATLRRRDANTKHEDSQASKGTSLVGKGYRLPTGLRRILYALFSRIFVKAFSMTFIAEWGNRSQIATVILAAREDVPGVCLGAILAHVLCIGLAVVGGRVLVPRISVRTVNIIGGVVFFIIAVTSIFLSAEFYMVLSDVEADDDA